MIMGSDECGSVLYDRGPNAAVEEPEITSKGEDQNPHTKRFVAQPMENEGRQEETDNCLHQQRQPGRADILDRLSFQAHKTWLWR